MLFGFHTSAWTSIYCFTMKNPQNFQVAAGERGCVCIWEQIDHNCWLYYNLVITHWLIDTVQIEKLQVEAEVKLALLLVSLNWTGCCPSQTEMLLLSSVVCSGRMKRETFKSYIENQDLKSHWLLMKVRGRCFCCASGASLLFLNCPSYYWWWMRCACATSWTPLATKVVSSCVVCYFAWTEIQIPCFHEEQSVITHTSLSLSSICCRAMSLYSKATWKIKALRTYCLVTLCWKTGYHEKIELRFFWRYLVLLYGRNFICWPAEGVAKVSFKQCWKYLPCTYIWLCLQPGNVV